MSSTGVWVMRVSATVPPQQELTGVWGPWQVGNASATDYAKMAKVWAHGLKLVDPSIKLVSCGEQVRTARAAGALDSR